MKKYFLIMIITICLSFQTAFAKDYSFYNLPSGQVLIVKEVHNNPIVTIDTWVKTGSINENDQNNGVAHFLEHMFFKGTQKYPAGKFDQILESKGAITNAATSRDFTHYYIEIPSKYFNLAMDLHSDMLLNPVLPRNELEMERKVVLEEIAKGNDNPDNVLYKKLNSALYKEHPYKREVIGTPNIIETIPREEMLKFYNTWYKPNNMITVVVGDVKTDEVIKSVEENFQAQNKTKVPDLKYKKEPQRTKIPPIVTNMDTQTGYLLIGFRGVGPKSKKDSAALDVLSAILGNGNSSRLYRDIQENMQLTTSIYSGHATYKDDSLFYIKAKFPPKNQSELEAAIFAELQNIIKNPVSNKELNIAKNIIKRDIIYSRESTSNIANELGYITLLMNNPSYYDTYLKDIEKVSVKDIQRVALKYLEKNKAAISYILPENQSISGYNGKKENFNFEINNNDVKISSSKSYPKNANAKLISDSGDTKKYLLENGLTLIVNQNKVNDIVAINMLSKGGFFQEIDMKKRGVGSLTSDMLLKGTNNYSFEELNSILDENGIDISSQMFPDVFSISLKVTKNEFPVSLEIFDEIINNMKFDYEILNNVRNKKLQSIKTSKDVPSTVAFDEMKNFLWENTFYQNSSKFLEKEYPKVNINDIKLFYNGIFAPKNTIVSVNGNVDEQKLIDYFSLVFNNKKAKTYNLNDYKNKIQPVSKSKEVNINKASNQTWIVLAYRTPPLDNIKDWAALKVIDSILGTGMSSRLFTVLRDQQGLAYTVASIYQSNMLQGTFAVYMGTNPQNAQKAKEGMINEINKLKHNFVSSKELSEAKDKILGNYLISKETNSDKASEAATFELYGRGYDFSDKYADYINAVTEQDVIEAANKYFSAPCVTIIVK